MRRSKKRGTAPQVESRSKKWGWILGALFILLAAIWAVTAVHEGNRRRAVLRRLPPQPDMSLNNETLRALVNQAETDLLEADLGPGVGALGNLYLANFFYDEASTCYTIATELDPENAQWPYFLAYVRTMMGDTSGVMALFDETLRLDPDYQSARLRRADNLYKSGDIEAAKSDYERCLATEPNNAYACLGLARIAIDRDAWDAAEASLRTAIDADPSFGAAHRLLASIHEHFGRVEEGDRELRIAKDCGRFFPAPDPWLDGLEQLCFHSDKLLVKGSMAEQAGKLDVARSLYERVIEIAPNNFDATFRLAIVLQKQNDRGRAELLFNRALTLESNDESRYPVIHSNLGEIYFRNGEIEKSVESLAKAIDLDPEFEAAHLSLGAVLTQQGHPEEAITHCQKALALNPDSDAAQFNWGLALLKLGVPDEAVAHFEEATRLNPQLAAAYYQIGIYHLQAGERDVGGQYMRRALDAAEKTGNQGLAGQIRQLLD